MFKPLIAFAFIVAPACVETPGAGGPAFEIVVSPLTLEGVGDVCYDLAVDNGLGQRVWSRSNICASRYGDGRSGISYVGSCDASPEAAQHQVTLTIASITDRDGAPLSDWVDPCAPPHADGCTLPARCNANGDTPVVFDLTVMRRAQQGFFDIAVELDTIFCSAKVDCADDDGPLRLVFDPSTGERVPTVVWAVACTDGDDASDTHLWMSDLTLRCGDERWTIPPRPGPATSTPMA